jgi:cation diffusion facilitator family transporter
MGDVESAIKLKIQKRIAFISLLLLVGKFIAWKLTNSVGILTDALESIVNVVTGFISLYSIRFALSPSDKEHPFGHGKVESLSASLEGLLIIVAGMYIIFEAIRRLFNPMVINDLDIGILIIAVAGLANYLMGYYSIINGRKHKSIALVASGKHLQTDTYSTIGLIGGLAVLYFTGRVWIDSAIAIIFGIFIMVTGYKILRETIANLLDKADFNILERIAGILWDNRTENWIEIHKLRLLKNGNTLHLYGDLTLPWFMNVAEAHREIDILRDVIVANGIDNVDITIHTDACTSDLCGKCILKTCTKRSTMFVKQLRWRVETMTRRKKHGAER